MITILATIGGIALFMFIMLILLGAIAANACQHSVRDEPNDGLAGFRLAHYVREAEGSYCVFNALECVGTDGEMLHFEVKA